MTVLRREELTAVVIDLFFTYREIYGCRRITREMNKLGYACSVGLVAKIMRTQGLETVQPRAFKVTTVQGESDEYPEDLINRDFTSSVPGTRLVGDITYLRTKQGWLYLAVVIDLATRMVVGWQIADHMRSSLVIEALNTAKRGGHVKRKAIFHSDRGTQYAGKDFTKFCSKIKVRRSMGRTGVCWDNAAAESFFATLKNEMHYRYSFHTRSRARFAVAEYIEVFYNRQRMHSSIGYRTPLEALTEFHQAAAAA
jgi:transposase InsO family protein